jgi:hypothetical protein
LILSNFHFILSWGDVSCDSFFDSNTTNPRKSSQND